MQKKTYFLTNLLLSMLWAMLSTFPVMAQINFSINQSNLGQGTIYVDNQSISFTTALSVAPTINLRTGNAFFTKGTLATTLNANLFRARIIGTGGQLNNLESATAGQDAILSTSNVPIYSSPLGLLSSGLINLRYTISDPKLYAWKAGLYTDNLNFVLSGLNVGSLSVRANIVNVTVDPFLKATQPQNVVFTINAFDFYRTRLITPVNQNLSITGTLNAGIRMKSNTANFIYSNGYQGGTDPLAPATVMMAQMTSPKIRPAEFLGGTTYKTITETTGIEVPIGNTSAVTIAYNLSNEVLKSNFLKKGTYTLNINKEMFDAEALGTPSIQSLPSTVIVNVADMAELIVKDLNVNLHFKTAEDYKNGVYVDMPGHVSLSATSPYDVFVQASSSSLSNGSNNIPISALQISASTNVGNEGLPILLKATRQRIFGTLPVIDKKIDIRYSISAAEAAKFIGNGSGTYTTSITYSLIAP